MGRYQYYVYLMTNKRNTVIYTGVTNNLERRVFEHKTKFNKGFSNKYKVNKLVYFEEFDYIEDAIYREKQIKAGPRQKKIVLIEYINRPWRDLSDGWYK